MYEPEVERYMAYDSITTDKAMFIMTNLKKYTHYVTLVLCYTVAMLFGRAHLFKQVPSSCVLHICIFTSKISLFQCETSVLSI